MTAPRRRASCPTATTRARRRRRGARRARCSSVALEVDDGEARLAGDRDGEREPLPSGENAACGPGCGRMPARRDERLRPPPVQSCRRARQWLAAPGEALRVRGESQPSRIRSRPQHEPAAARRQELAADVRFEPRPSARTGVLARACTRPVASTSRRSTSVRRGGRPARAGRASRTAIGVSAEPSDAGRGRSRSSGAARATSGRRARPKNTTRSAGRRAAGRGRACRRASSRWRVRPVRGSATSDALGREHREHEQPVRAPARRRRAGAPSCHGPRPAPPAPSTSAIAEQRPPSCPRYGARVAARSGTSRPRVARIAPVCRASPHAATLAETGGLALREASSIGVRRRDGAGRALSRWPVERGGARARRAQGLRGGGRGAVRAPLERAPTGPR